MAKHLPFVNNNEKLVEPITPFQAYSAMDDFYDIAQEIYTRIKQTNGSVKQKSKKNSIRFEFVSKPEDQDDEQRKHYFIFGASESSRALTYVVTCMKVAQQDFIKQFKFKVLNNGEIVEDEEGSFRVLTTVTPGVPYEPYDNNETTNPESPLANNGWQNLLGQFSLMDRGRMNDLYESLKICENDASGM
jgi:hypothetical protein